MLGFGLEVQPNGTPPGLDVGEHLGDAGVRAGSDDAVNLGDQALQLRAVTLRQAARDDQLLTGALARGVLEDDVRGLLLRGIDERARIDHDGLGVAGLRFQPPAGRAELGDHHLGVNQILGATEADERDASHRC